MARKRPSRVFREIQENYFRDHPEEIAPYIDEIFEEYANGGRSAALLSSLRVVAKVKGITNLAESTGMTRQGIQHALSSKGNPRFDNVNAIIQALGYRLTPVPVEKTPSTSIRDTEDQAGKTGHGGFTLDKSVTVQANH